ncbi:hypothetical protein, partial [Fusobacterium gonidiaformans]|uniref:hypothetical protein n=1 Tax=Fusobacterium gonidiaformans TaxID=849 RepID=UPI00307D463F
MLEEKSVKHWLKRKVKFTQALLVAFLITGGMSFANTIHEVGAFGIDKKHANIYTMNMPGLPTHNEVGTEQTDYVGGISGSNIALGSGNMAGVELVPIEEKVMIGGEEKTFIKGYERKRSGNGFLIPLWNKKESGKGRTYSTAVGFINAAYGVGAFAIGQYSVAGNKSTFAGGLGAVASAEQAFSFGKQTKAMGENSVAFGEKSEAYGKNSFAAGRETKAKGDNSASFGNETEAIGGSSFAAGSSTKALGYASVAMGSEAEAKGHYSIALGRNTKAEGEDSFAAGYGAKAVGANSMALGTSSQAEGVDSLAMAGAVVEKNANYGIAIGKKATTKVAEGLALGSGSLANRGKNVYGYNPVTNTFFDDKSYSPEKVKELEKYNKEISKKSAKVEEAANKRNKIANDLNGMLHGTNDIEFTSENWKRLNQELAKANSTYKSAVEELNKVEEKKYAITGAYQSSDAAISIGNSERGTTRQITGVAAGSKDTDAVNVAQLKKVKDSINTAVENSKIHYYSVNSNKVGDDSNYKNNGATGDDAIAIGIGVKAKGQHAIAMGNNVESSGYASIAIGKDSEATKQGAIAIGMGAKVYAGGGVAIGTNVQAGDSPSDGDLSPVALGHGTKSTGGASTAFGYESVASGAHAIAGGDRSKATGQDSVALGQEVEASGTWSVALGQKTVASASNSMAMGENTEASGNGSTAMGIKTEASGAGSTTMGYGTKAIGDWSLATGAYSKSEGEFSTAMGLSSIASGYNSFAASGANVEKEASNAIAMGYNATAKLTDSVALGSGSVASTKQGVAGYNPITDKNYEKTPEAEAAYQKWIDAYNAWEAIDEAEKDKKTEKLKECNAMKTEYNKLVSTWESTKSVIAVGDKEKGISRQITGVAAGTEDTDAVNVAQLKALNTKVDKGASHYYSVNDIDDHVDNYKNDGAKGVYSTVAGPGSTIKQTNNQMFQGATSAILGSFNTIDAGDKEFDGVANSIVGVANTTKDANGSLIFGAGNKITNSYRGVDFAKLKGNGLNLSDSQSVAEALGKLVANSGGSVLAIGGANTADYATLSKVIGVGNTLKGSAQNESTLNMIDGFKNTGTNIKNTTIVGSENTVENGSSNILIGDKHKLKKVSNSVILGSTEQETETTVSDVVSIGHNAKVEKKGGIALGSSSVANREKGQAGFDISTNLASTDKSATWKATHSALSIGDGSTVTRQITGVAAGRADTDAVNVAQLKSVLSHPFHVFSGGKDISKGTNFTFYQMNWEFRDGLKAAMEGEGENRRVVVSLDKESLKKDSDFKGPKGDKGDTGVAGPKGDKGDTGVAGPKGDKGDTGAAGPKGDKGDTGAAGPKGDKGDTGVAGPKGDKGDAGVAGPQGPKGDKGDAGVAGPKGDKGDTGVAGP